ncbi:MAG: hypothetical protein RMK52_05500 [Chitinophagales bacterium]|nr:hypothetical protein [Chitinophagales bacterium]MDW8393684.1 hypothetical protein [Chitinophagales bacterium]
MTRWLLLPFWLLLAGCEFFQPGGEVPSYVQIASFTFSAGPGQGSSSQRITDVWLYDEADFIGAFELPRTIPVLRSGASSLYLLAGIWDNGISEVRVPYPFYQPDTVLAQLVAGQVTSVTPTFTYRKATRFHFIEDFEAGNLFSFTGGDTMLMRQSQEIFEGSYSAALYLDKAARAYEGRSPAYTLPLGEPVYVELNYRCDHPFQVGLLGTKQGINTYFYKWNINPKPYWNKIYLNLGRDVNEMQADQYHILLRAVLDTAAFTQAAIYLDNIKLVSF